MGIVIRDTSVMTVDKENRIIENTNVYIRGNKIIHIGSEYDGFEGDIVINGKNKLLMPGLINAHTHLGMSLFRNYADDLPLFDWLSKKIWPLEAKLNKQDIYWGSLLSMAEMIETGTTSFCDMYFLMDEVARGMEESGIRGVLTRGIIEDKNDPDSKLNDSISLYKRYDNGLDGRIKVMLAPHGVYTNSPEYLMRISDLAKELNTGIHIHLSETKQEVEDCYRQFGRSPVKHSYELGLFENHTLAAHCVHLSDEDIEILLDNNVYPVNNPGSNLKLASGFAPIDKMIKKGIKVALGTDGASSNNNLNLFKEMNLAALINKAVNLDALSVSANDAIRMATINGAYALNWVDEIGSIEVGKKADLILIDLNGINYYPRHNLESQIAYSSNGKDVHTVIIDGKIVYKDKEFTTIDIEKVKYMADCQIKDLLKR